MGAIDDIQSITREGMDLMAQSSGLSWSTTVDGTYTAFTDGHIKFERPAPEVQQEIGEFLEWDATLYISDTGTSIQRGYFIQDENADKWFVVNQRILRGMRVCALAFEETSRYTPDRGGIDG